LTVNGDGTQLSAPITVDANAATGWHAVKLTSATGEVPFGDIAKARFYVGAGVPSFSSIEPILATQGSNVTLTIRGQHFQNATAVTATPADGITFTFPPTVNSDGTQVMVPFSIAPDAPLGSRVIQLTTPAATSSDAAGPENTFTVYPP
jgi:hypothetical protein